MGKRRKPSMGEGQFWQSLRRNNRTWDMFYNQILDMAINVFEWKNLPDEIDPRFIELKLISRGHTLFFKDDDMLNVFGETGGRYLCLPCTLGGMWNVYNVPTKRRAYASNGYHKDCTENDSVIIYNNYLRQPELYIIYQYADRLYEVQRAIDVNVKAQKTPVTLVTNDKTRLSMLNVYEKYEGNEPYIVVDESFNMDGIKVLKTDAPYLASKLQDLKHEIFNEALTHFGIANVATVKKERLISDEISRNLGGTEVEKNVRLNARKDACEKINKMFGLNIDVEYNKQFDLIDDNIVDDEPEGGDFNE